MLDRLISLVSRLGQWSYLIIFLGVFLECAAFLGFVVPGETLAILGGFLAAQGVLNPFDLAVLVCAGAILGDSVGFEWGRRFGRGWIHYHGRWIPLKAEHLEHVERFFQRHGGKAVFLGRFTVLLRSLTPFVAGSSGISYWRFLAYNAAGGVVWGAGCVVLGYVAGASWRVVERWAGRAGAVLGAFLLTILALLWLWRWLVRHEADVKRMWARVSRHPWVDAFRDRFAPLLGFLRARLTPGGYLGLKITFGVVVIVAAAWIFGGIAQDVVAGDPLTLLDRRIADWLHAHETAPLTDIMSVVSALASPAVAAGISLAAAVVLLARRDWNRFLSLVLIVPGGVLLNLGLQQLFHRHGPAFEPQSSSLASYSFPSGHATAVVLLYGLLAIWTVGRVRRWRWRVPIVLAAFVLVLSVDFSRIYLGIRYLSDVLAANALGVAWLALCLTGVSTLRQTRQMLEAGNETGRDADHDGPSS